MVSARARILAEHAARLTRNDVDEAALVTLRAHGLTDEAIHDLTQVVGFFNFYNRLVDGLGVDDEPEWA